MVFSSFPAYLDHPNWHQLQQPNYQQGSGSENPRVSPPPPPPPPQVGVGGGSGIGSIRPGSMVDRARVAKLPQPEPGLKCPRCDSTNTKFCYFNNYSLTQPRHFCKTCRRYWTRGGSLRNVPVGGGCRRNKRSKSSSSKSQVASQQQQKGPMSSSASPSSTDISSHFPQPSPQLPFMATLQNLIHYGGGNAGGLQPQMAATGGGAGQNDHMGFQLGSNSGGSNNILFSGGGDQWRLPFLSTAGFEQPTNNLYPFYQSEGDVEAPPSSVVGGSHLGSSMTLSSGVTPQLAPVKMEDNQRLNLSRQLNGSSEMNQYWVGNTWTDFSGLNSSSH